MTPLQYFQIAFADYCAGHLTLETLLECANKVQASHPNYVASLLQKFKMSKSAPSQAPSPARRPSPETAGGRECWVLFDVDGIVRDVRGITERAWGYDKHGWTWRRMVEPPALVEGDKGPGGAG